MNHTNHMNTLVTGGAGFIGSHVVRRLLDLNTKTLVIDDLSTGKLSNVPEGAEFVNLSILDLDKTYLKDIDCVIHLAALSSVPQSFDHSAETELINCHGTEVLLNSCKDAGVKKVIFASSSSVYGDSQVEKQNEFTELKPSSPYALSKLKGERLCNQYTSYFGVTILRYFNVYGPNQNLNSAYSIAVPSFIDNARKNLPLTIYGDGEQTRDFIFIDDVVAATIDACLSDMTGVYNVGSGIGTSINTLAATIIWLLSSDSEIIHKAARKGDPRHTCADIRKLVDLGYMPWCGLRYGLKRIIDGN